MERKKQGSTRAQQANLQQTFENDWRVRRWLNLAVGSSLVAASSLGCELIAGVRDLGGSIGAAGIAGSNSVAWVGRGGAAGEASGGSSDQTNGGSSDQTNGGNSDQTNGGNSDQTNGGASGKGETGPEGGAHQRAGAGGVESSAGIAGTNTDAGKSGSGIDAGEGGNAGTPNGGQAGMSVVAKAGTSGNEDTGASAAGGGVSFDPCLHAGTLPVQPPSCANLIGNECRGEDCCLSPLVTGGTFMRGRGTETCATCSAGCPAGASSCNVKETPEHAATVHDFRLDKYEVTVGRFRKFVATYAGYPAEGAGTNPWLANSGWQAAWNVRPDVPNTAADILHQVVCGPNQTWTAEPAPTDARPINCVNWYQAFAFCAWDGGWLPTETEWEFAAAGGSENRLYPWGDATPDPNRAAFHLLGALSVGSMPGGDGRFCQADLAGLSAEWLLDLYQINAYVAFASGIPCDDCANLLAPGFTNRVVRGGSWLSQAPDQLRAAQRDWEKPPHGSGLIGTGFRCARKP